MHRYGAPSCLGPRLRKTLGRGSLLLLLVASGRAWPQDVRYPPSLLLPNYDRVYPGLVEALEGGAFIARARNAPAVAYNPADLCWRCHWYRHIRRAHSPGSPPLQAGFRGPTSSGRTFTP